MSEEEVVGGALCSYRLKPGHYGPGYLSWLDRMIASPTAPEHWKDRLYPDSLSLVDGRVVQEFAGNTPEMVYVRTYMPLDRESLQSYRDLVARNLGSADHVCVDGPLDLDDYGDSILLKGGKIVGSRTRPMVYLGLHSTMIDGQLPEVAILQFLKPVIGPDEVVATTLCITELGGFRYRCPVLWRASGWGGLFGDDDRELVHGTFDQVAFETKTSPSSRNRQSPQTYQWQLWSYPRSRKSRHHGLFDENRPLSERAPPEYKHLVCRDGRTITSLTNTLPALETLLLLPGMTRHWNEEEPPQTVILPLHLWPDYPPRVLDGYLPGDTYSQKTTRCRLYTRIKAKRASV